MSVGCYGCGGWSDGTSHSLGVGGDGSFARSPSSSGTGGDGDGCGCDTDSVGATDLPTWSDIFSETKIKNKLISNVFM